MSLSCPNTGVKPNGVWTYRSTGRLRNGVRPRFYGTTRFRVLQIEGPEVVPQKNTTFGDGVDSDRMIIELTFARSKVQDVQELHSTAERQLTELLDLYEKTKQRARSAKPPTLVTTPVTVHKQLEWEEGEEMGVFVKTTREEETQGNRKRGITVTEQSCSPLVSKSPAISALTCTRSGRLLTGDEEKDLAVLVRKAVHVDELKRAFLTVMKRPAADDELAFILKTDELSLRQDYELGTQAKKTMFERNMRLVLSMAAKIRPQGASLQTLVVEGSSGLMRAIEKFDPEKGFKLSTYAHWWIKQAMKRALTDSQRLIKVPGNVADDFQKIMRARDRHMKEHRVSPSDAELAEKLGYSEKRYHAIKNAYWRAVSIDTPMSFSDNNSPSRADILEDPCASSPEEFLSRETMQQEMEGVLTSLPEKEATILRLRYGLEDGEERTLDDVGYLFHISRERVRQIEMKALRKLRYRNASLAEHLLSSPKPLRRTSGAAHLKAC